MIVTVLRACLCAMLVLGLSAAAGADGGDSSGGDDAWKDSSRLKPAQDVIALGDYNTAIEKLTALRREDPKDPDVLNLLGFSYRKLGDFDNALRNYEAALALKPKHLNANEYLGELYLQTGRLDKAQERLAVLDDACFFGCKQYTKLKQAIKAYKQDNGLQ